MSVEDTGLESSPRGHGVASASAHHRFIRSSWPRTVSGIQKGGELGSAGPGFLAGGRRTEGSGFDRQSCCQASRTGISGMLELVHVTVQLHLLYNNLYL